MRPSIFSRLFQKFLDFLDFFLNFCFLDELLGKVVLKPGRGVQVDEIQYYFEFEFSEPQKFFEGC